MDENSGEVGEGILRSEPIIMDISGRRSEEHDLVFECVRLDTVLIDIDEAICLIII